jgi:hypothetical protein
MHFLKCIERKEIIHPKMQNPKPCLIDSVRNQFELFFNVEYVYKNNFYNKPDCS